MGSNVFGGSQASTADTAPFVPSAPGEWPVRIEKVLGIAPLKLLGMLAFVGVVTIGPVLAQGVGLVDALTSTMSGAIFIGVGVLFGGLMLLRRRARLVIDSSGIDFRAGKNHSFYAWGDISGFEDAPLGVRVCLKDRTPDQNQYNLIGGMFAKNSEELKRLLVEGREKYGEGAPRGRSDAFADDLRTARMKTVRIGLVIVVGVPVLLFALLARSPIIDSMKKQDLRAHGRRAEAAVTRVFTADCDRRGECTTHVQFRYVPDGSGRAYASNGSLDSDQDVAYARSHDAVPIVYDPRKPSTVALNLGDEVFKDPFISLFSLLMILGGISVLSMIILAAAFSGIVLRALRTPAASPQNTPIVG